MSILDHDWDNRTLEEFDYYKEKIRQLEEQLDYLTFFHREADFGPTHIDVLIHLQHQYKKKTGKEVPSQWRIEE
jgi:hypothetical protein